MRRALGLMLVLALAGTAHAQPKEREPTVRGKTVAAWIKMLDDKEAVPRFTAISALTQAGPEARKAVPALINVFRDRNATFLYPLAAVALSRVGPDAVPELLKSLDDKADAVKSGSAWALGMMGPQAKAATKALDKALADKDASVRFASAQALGRIGPGAKDAVPALNKALDDETATVRVEAAAALWRVAQDNRGTDALVKALDDENATIVQVAIATLGEMGTAAKPAAEALKKIAQKDRGVPRRIQAAEALYRVSGDGEAVKVVVAALDEKQVETRKDAVAVLGTMGTEEKSVSVLKGLLDDKNPVIRREAACSLCDRSVKIDADLVKVLLAKLSDPDLSVRWWSAVALLASDAAVRKFEDDLMRALRIPFRRGIDKDTSSWTVIQDTAGPSGQRATAALVSILKSRPTRFKAEAARTLTLLGMDAKAAQPALLEAFSGDKFVRRAAAEAVAQTGPEMIPTLVGLLTNKDEKVRESAARALGQMGGQARSSAKALTRALKDDDSGVRVQAALALWHVDADAEAALPAMNLVLKDVDNKDRWEAVEGIGIVSVEARPIIKGLLDILLTAAKDREPAVKMQGLKWFHRRSGKARETATLLRDGVTDRDAMVREMTVRALGETGAEGKIVEPLSTALEDKDVGVRLAAEEALARGGKDMVPDLIAALKNKSPRVRAGVARALGMIGPDAKEASKALLGLKDDKDEGVKVAALDALRTIIGGDDAHFQGQLDLLKLIVELELLQKR